MPIFIVIISNALDVMSARLVIHITIELIFAGIKTQNSL